MNKKHKQEKKDKGDSVLGFAAVLPLFMMILGVTGILAWAFWAQSASAMMAAEGVRQGGLDRGGQVHPEAGAQIYSTGVFTILGGKTGATVGNPDIFTTLTQRQVRYNLSELQDVSFGFLGFQFKWAGGGAARMHDFYPGPPDPWE